MLQSLRHKIVLVVALYASIMLLAFGVLYWLNSEQSRYLEQHQNIPDVVEVSFRLNNAIQNTVFLQQNWLLTSDRTLRDLRQKTWADEILPEFNELGKLYRNRIKTGERSVERRAYYDLRLMILELQNMQNELEINSEQRSTEEILNIWSSKQQPLMQQISGQFEFLIRWQGNHAREKYDELQRNISNIGLWSQLVALLVLLMILALGAYFAKLIMNPLRNMSHELRTPLNAIINFTEILLESGDEDPLTNYQTDRLKRILKSGRHLLDLITSLLDLSKMDAAQMKVTKTDFHLEHLLKDVVDWLEPLMQEKSIKYETDFQSDVPFSIHSDAGKIRQIIINLLGNAIKFTEVGGHIKMIVFQDENSISIHIQDNGCGIPNDQQKRIFEVFHQAKSSGTQSEPGSGLGLPLVQSLVKLLEGSISVQSTPGEGSTFKVKLPKNTDHQ